MNELDQSESKASKKGEIFIIDDDQSTLEYLKRCLEKFYKVRTSESSIDALDLILQDPPDLILSDLKIPDLNGINLCKVLKREPQIASIPFIIMTGDALSELEGRDAGADDFITKPINKDILLRRLSTHIKLKLLLDQTRSNYSKKCLENIQLQEEIIYRLLRAVEYKDPETGEHLKRISQYSKLIAEKLGESSDFCYQIGCISPMHDVGKVGIPESILLKPDKLTPEEFEVVKEHTKIGKEILGDSENPLLQIGAQVAYAHHEKWDGTGYPLGIQGEEIDLYSRIVSLVDVFDALISSRPYKGPWSFEDAMAYIDSQSFKHFDPKIVEVFLNERKNILEILKMFPDKKEKKNFF